MSQNYSWHSDDEAGWGAEETAQPPVKQAPTARRWHRPVVVATLVLGIVCVLFWQAQQRIEAATETVSNDVRSSYTLLARAIVEKDSELFNVVVSGRDPAWMALQQRLLEHGLHFDRHPMGIDAQTPVPHVVAITPAPNLDEAEVTVAAQYSGGGVKPVTLQQSLVFRRAAHGWLLSPPRREFWGAWETERGSALTLAFRQRDGAIARRLLEDLDAQVDAMCASLADINCPDDLALSIRLASDPGALLTVAGPFFGGTGRSELNLPTPGLVGLPVDEAGYRMLLRSYARPIVAAAIAEAIGRECCENPLFHQALLDYQLDALGLHSWPLTASEYETMFRNPVLNTGQLARYWSAPPGAEDGWRQVYSVVAYLLHADPSLSAATMQRQLLRADDYRSWMRRVAPDFLVATSQQDWIRYAQSQLAAPNVAPPTQDVLLLCDSARADSTSLYRYDPGSAAWQTELEETLFLSLSAAGDRAGAFLLDRLKQMRRTRALVWRAESTGQLLVQALTDGLFRLDIAGEELLIYAHDHSEPFASSQRLTTAECRDSWCETTVIRGLPVRSPDGMRSLFAGQDGTIWLVDGRGTALWPMGAGTAPFWLDNRTFGFVRPPGERSESPAEIAVADVVNRDVQGWIRLETLVTAASAAIATQQLTINAARVSPANSDLLFIAASTVSGENRDRSYVFLIDRRSQEISLLTESAFRFGRQSPFAAAPDGRWLTINSFDRHSAAWQLHLYDSRTGNAQTVTSAYPFPTNGFDWSPDSRWLLRVQDGYLHLLDPAQGAQLLIDHEYDNCSFAAWTD